MTNLTFTIGFILNYTITHNYTCRRRRCFPPGLPSLWTWPTSQSNDRQPEWPTPCCYCDSARETPGTDPRTTPQCWSDGCTPDTSPVRQKKKKNVSTLQFPKLRKIRTHHTAWSFHIQYKCELAIIQRLWENSNAIYDWAATLTMG